MKPAFVRFETLKGLSMAVNLFNVVGVIAKPIKNAHRYYVSVSHLTGLDLTSFSLFEISKKTYEDLLNCIDYQELTDDIFR